MAESFDFGAPATSSASLDGTSEASLYELIALQRAAVEQARATHGADSRLASLQVLLLKRLLDEAQGSKELGTPTALERAAELGDVMRIESPDVAAGLKGKVNDLALGTLRPFYLEALRPQAEFNRVLVELLPRVMGSTTTPRPWVRQQLTPLAEPTAWKVHSHRSDLSGRFINLTKRAWLEGARQSLTRRLEQQRRWNQLAVDVLVDWNRAEGAAVAARLEAASPEVDGQQFDALLSRQRRFNAQIVSILRAESAVPSRPEYDTWVRARATTQPVTVSNFPVTVVIDARSETSDTALKRTLASLEAQSTSGWTAQVMTATSAKPEPRAEWLCFVEAGDELAPHAISTLAQRLAREPFDLAYADEDRLESGKRASPFFKPDFERELLLSCDWVSHGLFVSRAAFERLGSGLRPWELALEASAATPPLTIAHLDEVLVTRHTSGPRVEDFVPADGATQLEAHLTRHARHATVRREAHRFSVNFEVQGRPRVSLIVPFRDKPVLLDQLTRSLRQTRYDNYELVLVSNNSEQPETFELLEKLKAPNVLVVEWNEPFHYPRINNVGARAASGEILVFLNNDTEIVDPQWLDVLVAQLQQPGVGAVGATLLFPNRTIQHAGVVVGLGDDSGGLAGHLFAGLPDDARWTMFGSTNWTRNFSAVTSACVAVRRSDFEALHGFDERFQVGGSDVDLCLRLRARGLRVVNTGQTRLIHHESASRRGTRQPGSDDWESFRAYGTYLDHDPCFSRHLSLTDPVPSLRDPDTRNGLAMALQKLGATEPEWSKSALTRGRLAQGRQAQGMARMLDFGQPLHRAVQRANPARSVTWFLPFFNHPFGGVHTILRFADLWRARGVESRFVIYDNPHVTERELGAKIAPLFTTPPGTFHVLKRPDDVLSLPPTDVAIATLWNSAYFALRHPNANFRAYFVQDYEPMFYPAGTMSGLCEYTYELGFFGLFNTSGLRDWVTAHHSMQGVAFEPSVDHALFHPPERRQDDRPVRVFFYGRPSIDRNAFELGIEALRELKRRLGTRVEIISAGEAWNPAWFGLEGVVENLGVLPYADTAPLYRTVDVGLCFMFTRHPSYLPLELMASGVTVVTNENVANGWLLEHGANCLLTKPSMLSVVEQLETASAQPQLRRRIGAAAVQRLHKTTWESEAEKLHDALSAACANPAEFA